MSAKGQRYNETIVTGRLDGMKAKEDSMVVEKVFFLRLKTMIRKTYNLSVNFFWVNCSNVLLAYSLT